MNANDQARADRDDELTYAIRNRDWYRPPPRQITLSCTCKWVLDRGYVEECETHREEA